MVFQEGMMNERFVAVSTVTGSRICGCFPKPRRDFNVVKFIQPVYHRRPLPNKQRLAPQCPLNQDSPPLVCASLLGTSPCPILRQRGLQRLAISNRGLGLDVIFFCFLWMYYFCSL